jgi:hypothetical protein
VPVTARTTESGQRVVGDLWPIDVEVTDLYGFRFAATPTVTITLPDGTTTTAVTESRLGGCYRALYELTVPGRHLAAAVAAGYGRADFALEAVEPTPAGGMPQLADANKYLGAHSASDDDVQGALSAETAAQRQACVVPAYYPDDLRDALLRRVSRNLAMRRIPLAVLQGDAEAGSTILPSWDPEISRLERPHLRMLVA